MPCRVSLNATTTIKCQFEVEEKELIQFASNHWCICHLPLQDNDGKKSQKECLDEIEKKKFNNLINQMQKEAENLNNTANYSHVVFPVDFTLHSSKHGDNLSFAIFLQKFSLKNGLFPKEINFSFAQFYKEANFKQQKLSHSTEFCSTKFHSSANFFGAIFSDIANFKSATFCDEAIFTNAAFEGKLNFESSVFEKQALFSTKNEGTPTPGGVNRPTENSKFSDTVSFSNAKFFANVEFTNRYFNNETNFRNCEFHVAPDFHGCTLHQNITFPSQSAFKDTHSSHAADAYRTLGSAMANFKARKEEAMFYALEQKSIRKNLKTLERTLSILYDLTTSYGQSIKKSLATFFIILVAFFLLYFLIASPYFNLDTKFNCQACIDAFEFSIKQVVRPFGVWSDTNQDKIGLLVKLLATFQSVLSLATVALILLTIRWRFKRE